jgi:hypothetical protein
MMIMLGQTKTVYINWKIHKLCAVHDHTPRIVLANAETDAPYHALRRVARRPDIPQAWWNLDDLEEYGYFIYSSLWTGYGKWMNMVFLKIIYIYIYTLYYIYIDLWWLTYIKKGWYYMMWWYINDKKPSQLYAKLMGTTHN